jgi:hypothetical protein
MPDDMITCNQSSVAMPEKLDEDNIFLRKIRIKDKVRLTEVAASIPEPHSSRQLQ